MTRSVYVIGGAGTGKSTFTGALIERLGWGLGPLHDFHSKRNAKALVTLRGHEILEGYSSKGAYLGVMREQFPGSDGLDRASSPTAEEWLRDFDLPEVILAEGATLATRRFLFALHEETELLVLALRCDPVIHDLRLLERGAEQVGSFVASTITKTENLVRDLQKVGGTVLWIDSDVPSDWEGGLSAAEMFLNPVI